MPRGKVKSTRNGSDSNSNSRASASDRKHDRRQIDTGKSLKAGTETSGKRRASQGGSKGEGRH